EPGVRSHGYRFRARDRSRPRRLGAVGRTVMTAEVSQAAAPWRPTAAHFRAASVAVVTLACALIFRRPDLLVIATPPAGLTAWGVLMRPKSQPAFECTLGHRTVREGDRTLWRCSISGDGGLDLAVGAVPDGPWIERSPTDGVDSKAAVDGAVALAVAIRSIRW